MLPSASNFKLFMVFTGEAQFKRRKYYRIDLNTSWLSMSAHEGCQRPDFWNSWPLFDICWIITFWLSRLVVLQIVAVGVLTVCSIRCWNRCTYRETNCADRYSYRGKHNDRIPRLKFNGRRLRHAYLRTIEIRIIAAFTTFKNNKSKTHALNHLALYNYLFLNMSINSIVSNQCLKPLPPVLYKSWLVNL